MDIEINKLKPVEVLPGFLGRFIHTAYTTVAYWEVSQGASIPMHQHKNEQLMQVTKGQFELTVDGVTRIYEPGMVVYLPPFTVHGGRALTPCTITDIFSPVREEYRFDHED